MFHLPFYVKMLNVNDQILTQPEKKTRPDVNQTISSVEMPLGKNAVYPLIQTKIVSQRQMENESED